jgi:putative ABC transport system permease protein
MIPQKQLELVRMGLRNLVGYPMRTILTMLGVVFGVGSVIAMLALGAGAERELLEEIGRLGIQNIIINSIKPEEQANSSQRGNWINSYGITFRDHRQILDTIPGLEKALPVHVSKKTVWKGSKRAEGTLYAVTPEHLEMFQLNTSIGRNLTRLDDEKLSRVCVVRSGILKELGIYQDPIGFPLNIDNETFYIVGVLKEDSFLGYARKALSVDAKSSEIYVPYSSVLRRHGTRSISRRNGSTEATDVELNQVVISVTDLDQVLVTARMLGSLLERNHPEKDYELVVPLEVLSQRQKTQQVFNIALVAIASISLLVGGIGIANIMLATVTERTKEIGIRRALGARRHHIISQFLIETTTISTIGGGVGVLVGIGLVQVLTFFTGWSAAITISSVVLSLSISMAVGIVSGIYPARRAAGLDPISALRHE